jgi:hypothetical protein
MASNKLDDLFASATAAHSRATDSAGSQTIMVDAVVANIQTAVTSGAFTSTYNATGKNSTNIQWVVEQLRQAGYTVTLSGSNPNIVISW